MQIFNSCPEAIHACLQSRTFSIAHIFSMEKNMNVPSHDCHEVYYSVSGEKQFVIDKQNYDFNSGNIVFISQNESYHFTQTGNESQEYYLLYIHPQYLKKLSTTETNLELCFTLCKSSATHRIVLSINEQQRFLYLILKLTADTKNFGREIIEQAHFSELIVFLNELYLYPNGSSDNSSISGDNYKKCSEILSYINQNLTEDLNMDTLSAHFALSGSYMSTLFKKETGTSIHKYISQQRISLAKKLLSEGLPVTEVYTSCGFGDYSNFLKVFKKTVGVSPKKFAQLSGITFSLPREKTSKQEPPHNLAE